MYSRPAWTTEKTLFPEWEQKKKKKKVENKKRRGMDKKKVSKRKKKIYIWKDRASLRCIPLSEVDLKRLCTVWLQLGHSGKGKTQRKTVSGHQAFREILVGE